MKHLRHTLTLALFAVLAVPVFVFSSPEHSTASVSGNAEEINELNKKIKEKQEKIKQLEASIEAYKKKASQKRLESISLSNQLSILDNRRAQVELDIERTVEKIETTELEIRGLALLVEDKTQNIETQEKIIGELIRTLYYEGNKKYIEVIAAYERFSDFYSRIQQLQKIEKDLGNQAQALRKAKEDLENKKEQEEEKQGALEALEKRLLVAKDDLLHQGKAKEGLLVQTQQSELKYKTLVESLRQQYQAIENEVSSIERQIRNKLEDSDKLDNLADDSTILSWPTQSRYVTAYYHDPGYPYRHVFEHSGIDIASAQGTPLKAAAAGYVARAKRCTTASCYSYALIVHGNGISTLYGHMSGITVSEDQFVTRGEIIGYSGAAPGTIGAGPFTTGPHLHFEVRKNGIPVNPLNYLVRDY